MKSVRTTCRMILGAGLALCVAVSSFYPRLQAAEARGTTARSEGPVRCCCGTKDGRCCGTACCQLPNPKGDNVPAPPKPSDERGQSLALPSGAIGVTGDETTVGYGPCALANSAIASTQSLVALSIRLNT